MTVCDIDGDGKMDIVTCNRIYIFIKTSSFVLF